MGENFVLGHTIGTWDIGTEEKRFFVRMRIEWVTFVVDTG
jgi:hypothetical protein